MVVAMRQPCRPPHPRLAWPNSTGRAWTGARCVCTQAGAAPMSKNQMKKLAKLERYDKHTCMHAHMHVATTCAWRLAGSSDLRAP